ncbi:hypothetical protein H4Q26_004052 [Puccinia striiformis f. sp. tritici PST-130]|nr:hypothetical protein H4Q26_004052 [Puccinia striiformis f. sp. tritici PST-130]
MKLRLETDNWASGNCYDYFISCSATCKKKRKKPRLVDLVDIRGQRRQLIEFCKSSIGAIACPQTQTCQRPL